MNSTDKKEIRKFGVISFFFFGCLCALGLWFKKPVPTVLFGFLSCLGLGFMSLPNAFRPVYRGWLKISRFMGKLITTVMLTLAYYLVMTPSALIKRLFGGCPIPMKFDRKASTYWVDRSEPMQPKERFLKRY